MAEEKKTEYCGPSQVTINIGTSGVRINDEGKPAPGVDLSKYVTREDADAAYAPLAQVAGIAESVRAAKADAAAAKETAGKALTKEAADAAYATPAQLTEAAWDGKRAREIANEAKTDVEVAKTASTNAERLTQQLAKNLVRFPPVIRLDRGVPVPEDTPLGAIIVRPAAPISSDPRLFPPISEWPKINAAEAGDGVLLNFQHQILSTGLEQLRPSEGKWHLTMRYSFPGGNFGEETGQANLYTVRRFQEDGHPAQADQGAKIATLEVRKGERQVLDLDIEPLKADPKVGDTWGVWLEAPIPSLLVHDLVLRRTA